MTQIEFRYWNSDIDEFRSIVKPYLDLSDSFEIHCWNEETDIFSKALIYGKQTDCDWKYGKVAKGEVTDAFRFFILTEEKPDDIDLFEKFTPFFNIFLYKDGKMIFSSSHYGTELYHE